jgi:hypothetical protein
MRLAGWLLWVRGHGGELWQQYIKMLPGEEDITCLLSFSREEAEQLQIKPLVVGAGGGWWVLVGGRWW